VARAIAPPAEMIFTTNERFSRTRSGHRGHRVPENSHAREFMRREESEDVGGHGGVGVWGGSGRVPWLRMISKIVSENIAERVLVVSQVPGADTLRCEERVQGAGGSTQEAVEDDELGVSRVSIFRTG
jgi:hypothetical protein